jgi:uncharacterized membrane-anchored protein
VTPLRLGLWIALAVVQLSIPAWMIMGQERVLRDGRAVKLQTRPVDPADAFRGRYVVLGFAIEEVPRELARGDFESGGTGYLELQEDADGFAQLVALHRERPDADLVLKVDINTFGPATVGVSLPFDRYYMDENAAPAAEAAYISRAAEEKQSWVTVRVLGDRAVIEELYIGGKPVREYLRDQQQ